MFRYKSHKQAFIMTALVILLCLVSLVGATLALFTSDPNDGTIRRDNTSGYTGISFRKNKWEARICYNKIRYMLGLFDTQEQAVSARATAEEMLRNDPESFVEYYSKNCKQYAI